MRIAQRMPRAPQTKARADELANLTLMMLGTYREMPGLHVTLPQAARLFGVDHGVCQEALERLTDSGVLRRRADGSYVLA